MAADPIIYSLEQVTDYDQFERLCSDMMAIDGFGNIEPIGGSKDRGWCFFCPCPHPQTTGGQF